MLALARVACQSRLMTATPTVDVSGPIADEVRAAMGRANRTRRALAEELGVDPMWVTRRLKGQTAWTIEDLVRVGWILEADPMTFIRKALA